MPITKRQRDKHADNIGGSDLVALFNLSRFQNATGLSYIKLGLVENSPAGKAAEAGTRLEPAVSKWLEEGDDDNEGIGKITRSGCERRVPGTPLLDHPDGKVVASGRAVEIKTAGLFGPLYEPWGNGPDDVPDGTVLQCQAHCLALETDICYVGAFIGGKGFRKYVIPRDDELIQIILDKVKDFWDHIERGEVYWSKDPPPMDVLKRIRRVPDSTVDIDGKLIANWRSLERSAGEARREADSAKARVLAAIDTAELGDGGDQGTVSYLPQERTSIDSKRLRQDKPDIFKQYSSTSTYRVMRHKKANPRLKEQDNARQQRKQIDRGSEIAEPVAGIQDGGAV